MSQAPEERNYHIFYDLIAGATDAEKKELSLKPPQEFHYLNQSGCYDLKNVSGTESMNEIREAMHTLGFNKHEKELFQAIAGILHLGNCSFSKADVKGMEGVAVIDTSGIF